MPPSPHWCPGPWNDGPDEPGGLNSLESITMGPGHGLYVPGGHWHTVESVDHSLAITYSVNVTRGLDLALEALIDALATQPGLRSPRLLRGTTKPLEPL
ncbi:unnamed protein product, partial [Laminaria digitata]